MPDEKCIINPARDCIGKAAAARLEMRIENLESWRDSSKDFHEKFYEWQRGQDIKSAKLDERLLNMETNLNKLVTWQENEKAKPGKRWESVVDKVLMLVIGAVVAFLLAKIGL